LVFLEKEESMARIFAVTTVAAALILAATPAFAQLGLTAPPSQTQPGGSVLSSTGGRFVFGQISGSGKDQFMLDTLTGRLWRIGDTSGIGIHLKSIPYRYEDGKVCPWPGEVEEGE
jgi:hypothetical protein